MSAAPPKEKSMMDKLSEGISSAFNTAGTEANKAKLANALRKRLVAIRHQELEYYRSNCRLLGDLSALVAGLAYQGIRYHYYLERKQSYMLAQGDAIEEVDRLRRKCEPEKAAGAGGGGGGGGGSRKRRRQE